MRPTRLRGARTNNLQDVDLTLEPGTLVAIAGPSGAGKSSLAFGTLYAEGQRRYVESFSAYARQFLERMARPPVDELEPVPAAIAVDRQAPVRTSRSTVGTMTEINDYLKDLWARAAVLICPGCEQAVRADSPQSAADQVLAAMPEARIVVTYPVAVADTEALLDVRAALISQGYRRVWTGGQVPGGQVMDIDEIGPEQATARGRLDVIADRTVAREKQRSRLVEALEAAMHRGQGRADVWPAGPGEALGFSRRLHCARCDREFRPATPGLFSFNSPIGACETCRGFGRTIGVDLDKVIPDPSLSLAEGAIRPWRGRKTVWERRELKRHCRRVGIPWTRPVSAWTPAQRRWLMEGDDQGWFGLREWFSWLESKSYKLHVRVLLARYRSYDECPACQGTRLVPRALWWRLGGVSIAEVLAMPVREAREFMEEQGRALAGNPALALLVKECQGRLGALEDVGLAYLTLDRASRTLSGGEVQRVALTSALGASLAGAMIVLDEPTVGLHPRDVGRLLGVIQGLARADNLAVVVEHEPRVLLGADRVVELGPGAGSDGGRVVFDGPPSRLVGAKTATGQALAAAPVTRAPREPRGWIELVGARGNNLQGVHARIPTGVLTCVTGVSGSGKSSLILETLAPAVRLALADYDKGARPQPLAYDAIHGADEVTAVVEVDQSPLGRTSRGNPATYLKIWDILRRSFAHTGIARRRGYTAGTFSFNVPGGRCEACKGEGAETVEMQFLADVTFSCPACGGRRFVGEVLDVRLFDRNVAEWLEMTAIEASRLVTGDRQMIEALEPLIDVGLGYLRLGQPLSTLSGGEAQRLKLAQALSTAPPCAMILLDEPTAGLHHSDVSRLLEVLDGLVRRGHTVVVVEHDMFVAAHADHVIDLGPGAGAEGGRIVASGTPRQVASQVDAAGESSSATAPFLAAALGMAEPGAEPGAEPVDEPGAEPGDVPKPRSRKRASKRGGRIEIIGAREHNLAHVSIDLPREKLVVVTGPSGSGKSTLAFDVLYAEGQRRFLETLSPYARQYMPGLPRPAVDRVTGVPPSVSLEQRTTGGGVNSTVATLTEVAHYLRVLYARAGTLHCPDCGVAIEPRPPEALARDVIAQVGKRAMTVMAPVVHGRKGMHRDVLGRAHDLGMEWACIDGEMVAITMGMQLDRYREHDVDLVIDTLKGRDVSERRLTAAIRSAAHTSDGSVRVVAGETELLLSTKRACPSCGRGFGELDPRWFSFNTRQGACETCEGRGVIVHTRGRGRSKREIVERCPECEGIRLSPLARAVTVAGRAITDIFGRSVTAALRELQAFELEGRAAAIGAVPLAEAVQRLAFLDQVGVGYLQLDRAARTLSGGEMQRVRLAAQLGSGLTGVLYVLDEPTIGLHPRDTNTLLRALRELVDRGNSVVVVEHDLDTIAAADHIVDIGPGGGRHGGRVVAKGSVRAIERSKKSVTGPALRRPAPVPDARRPAGVRGWIELLGASAHNLREVDVRVPLGALVAVTGVSGSGKTTLTREVLLRAVRRALGLATEPPGAHRGVRGTDSLRQAIEIDQRPIGRTPRSVPATYVKVWTAIRKLLAQTPEARARGYGASRFSFNVAEGRCEVCAGQGVLTMEMSFLPQVLMPCDACGGMRFDPETLDVTWRGLSAGEILDLDVADAVEVFRSVTKVAGPLRLLDELGLGYLKLGQPSNTLSGGEAQRLKLVSELGARGSGGTLYIMDEPTTGLHRDDVARLLKMLHRLVDRGDTVVVIEHHPDVMVSADWVIDLGPEGGEGGGRVVMSGTPEQIAACEQSHTGVVIAKELYK